MKSSRLSATTTNRTASQHSGAAASGLWEVVPGVYDCNPETATEFSHGPEIVCGDETIAYMQMHGEDKAELIVRAVNAHADMLAALREVQHSLRDIGEGWGDAPYLMTVVTSAIAKAEPTTNPTDEAKTAAGG